jgi:hypothetical protein
MKYKNLFLMLVTVTALTGCATNSSQKANDKKPPYANNVQILMYDSAPRPKTDHVDVYDTKLPGKPYKVIALMTYEARPDEEIVVTRAVLYRARQMGAQGVIDATTVLTNQQDPLVFGSRGGFGGGSKTRCVFRFQAIVYE